MAMPLVDKLKIYIFPGLASLLGLLIWTTVNDIKDDLNAVQADIKILMAQSNIDKTRIDDLERTIYHKTVTYEAPSMPPTEEPELLKREAILPDTKLIAQAKFKAKKYDF